jgi:enoyl-CoA hydratase/carnithine racemase
MSSATKVAQARLTRVSASQSRVVLDNPPLNLMGSEFVLQIREIVTALENDEQVKVVVFESAVDGFFLNHSDFREKLEDLTNIPQGPTGLEAWPDVLVRLTRAPFVSIALIRGRATGNGSELLLACDMSFASQEKALFSQWEVGAALVPGGGPMARLPRLMGRGRALEVLLSADDIEGADAERLGYVTRALPDADLNDFVDALAARIASFDKWAIANTKRLVNDASLPPDVEIRAGWDTFLASIGIPPILRSPEHLRRNRRWKDGLECRNRSRRIRRSSGVRRSSWFVGGARSRMSPGRWGCPDSRCVTGFARSSSIAESTTRG